MDLSGVTVELFLQSGIGLFIIGQLQRLITKVGGFSERLNKLEAEHTLYSAACYETFKDLDRRRNNQPLEGRRQQ